MQGSCLSTTVFPLARKDGGGGGGRMHGIFDILISCFLGSITIPFLDYAEYCKATKRGILQVYFLC